MQGLFFESSAGDLQFMRAVVVLVGFWTAWRSGKAVAEGWGAYPQVLLYTLLLAGAMQFLHYALFEGPVLSRFYFLVDLATLLIFSTAGFRYYRTKQMVTNYHWLYERTSAFTWRDRAPRRPRQSWAP